MAKITLTNEPAQTKSGSKFTRYLLVKNYTNTAGDAKEFRFAINEVELKIVHDLVSKEIGLLELEKNA